MARAETLVQELYVDDEGHHRHTNCQGRFCRVINCRDSIACHRDEGPLSYPESFAFVRQVRRDG